MTEDQTTPPTGTPDIQINPPAPEAPAPEALPVQEAPAPAAPELPPAEQQAPQVPIPTSSTPAPEATEVPEIQAPEIVKPPQPDSSILDEPKPTNSEEGFFKKNKMFIIGGVVILIVITIVVGILLSIKNADKLEGKLKLLESQQSALLKADSIVMTGIVNADTLDTATPAAQPKTMPNITPLFKAK
ncbi:MAG: hypothetical protein WC604_05010 [Candidatus Gracilibacteria bacterium]